MGKQPRLAIFASGRGSNALALMEAIHSDFIPASLEVVLSNKPGAPVLSKAQELGYRTKMVPSRGLSRAQHEDQLLEVMAAHSIDHVLLAGYMRILSPRFLRGFSGTILNIHPALLPDFPGLRAAEKQWEAGVEVAGATVHLVDEGVDTGPVVLQGSLVVRGDEGPEGLASRILHEVEHVIYPRAVRLYLDRLARASAHKESAP